MALEQKLVLKQAQKLIMTPQLQQAIRLLPLTKLELVQTIRQELMENPLLEEETTLEGEINPQQDNISQEAEADTQTSQEIDWDTYIQNSVDEGGSMESYSESIPFENSIKKKTSLKEHLEWQIDLSASTDYEKEIAFNIAGNLNPEGFLKIEPSEIAEINNYPVNDVAKALRLIQSLDPSGIGTRDLRESLILQIQQRGMKGSVAETIVRDHHELIESRHYEKIASRLNLPIDKVIEAVRVIKRLAPNPAYRFNTEDIHYIVPDVIVVKVKDDYQIILNEEGMPGLTISPFYKRILQNKNSMQKSTKEYVEEKFKSALWLIKSIEQRRNTIIRTAQSIVKFQKNFLDNGIEDLKPLILKDVARDIEMHESTISRVTTNKYMHTPQGLFEFKYFFHSGIDSGFGGSVSSVTIKDTIRDIIEHENPASTITDIRLSELLNSKNIKIARRTVTKYRKELKIPPANKRRRPFV